MEVNNKNAVKSAKKWFEKMGVVFIDTTSSLRHCICIRLNSDTEEVKFVNPICMEMNENHLLQYKAIAESMGFCGKKIMKAVIDAVKDLNETDQSITHAVLTCCYVKTYNSTDFVEYFMKWIRAVLDSHHIKLGKKLSHKTARNIWWSLGGYRGVKALCINGITATVSEFERIRNLEESFEEETPIKIENPEASVEYNPCLTCTSCKVDKDGMRICNDTYVRVPDDLTTKEIEELYPKVFISPYGHLSSKYVIFNIGHCEYYTSRIGSKTSDVEDVIHEAIATVNS